MSYRLLKATQSQLERLAANQQMQQQDTQLILHRMEIVQSSISEMQAEVRGIQTETRRILERLEQHFSDGHGGSENITPSIVRSRGLLRDLLERMQ